METKTKETKVGDVMTRDLFVLKESDELAMAESIFLSKKIRHLPVIGEEGKLIGILSHTDILRLSFGDIYQNGHKDMEFSIFELLTVGQVMKKEPNTVTSDFPVIEVAKILTKEEYHALPVVDDDRLVGIITTTDVIKFLLENAGVA